MMSLQKVFINFYLIAIPFYGLGQINLDRVIPKNVFSEIQTEQIMFNDKTYNSIFFSTVIPKKIIVKELENLYNDIGNIEKEKKIYKVTIKTKGELLSLLTNISKKNLYIGTKCKFAIKYLDEMNFYKNKCRISKELAKIFEKISR